MVEQVDFIKTAEKKYRRYGLHVLGFRHFPEGRDGLTPVQRRALWSLYQLGASDRGKKVATSRAVGECTGRFHPHEDDTVVSAMAKISQADTMAPTIIGVGNWGTWEDPFAAKRYTKCYLSPYAMSFFDSDEMSQVPMDKTYDGSDVEPRYLPAPLPHLMLHGTNGIAPGARANVPPCEPSWVLDSLDAVLSGKKLRAPEAFAFRYGGVLKSLEKSWLTSGTGSAQFRPRFTVDESRRAVVLLSLAPKFNPYALDEKLRAFPFYGGMSAEPSADNEIRIFLLCKRGHDLTEMAKEVKKRLSTRDSFAFFYINQVTEKNGDVGYDPRFSNPLEYLRYWVDWRKGVVSGAAAKRIDGLNLVVSRTELMIRVIAKRSAILKVLDKSKSRDQIKVATASILKCTAEEADYVLGSVNLYRLATIEVAALREKIEDAKKQIKVNAAIVKAPEGRLRSDAEKSHASLVETLKIAADIRKGDLGKKKRKPRRARGTRS